MAIKDMPRSAAQGKENAKRSRLTLSELASYDDICTDALVDNVSNCSYARQIADYSRFFSGQRFAKIAPSIIQVEDSQKSLLPRYFSMALFVMRMSRKQKPNFCD